MRLLHCGGFCHKKNEEGIRLMAEAFGIEYVHSNSISIFGEDWDFVFIPSEYIPPELFPRAKRIVYGPHNFVFPTPSWLSIDHKHRDNVYYNTLSAWNTEIYGKFGFQHRFKMVELPFAVNVGRFKPADDKSYERECFIYYKDTNLVKLKRAEEACRKHKLKYEVIVYGRYKEDDYIRLLHTSRFGIWVGRHESQGFALEEALAMNVPLVVWDVKSMFEEVKDGNSVYAEYRGRHGLESSCVPYWDSTCGMIVTSETIEEGIRSMHEHYAEYKPRDFIERILGPRACMQRWLDLLGGSERRA